MKKIIIALITLLLFSLILPGCTGGGEKSIDHSRRVNEGSGGVRIYASFYPMYFLASEIAGDRAKVVTMVPAGVEPHDWEPTPKMIIELNKSDMLVYNGVEMEPWIDNVLSNIDKDITKVVDASSGIELMESDKSGEEEEYGRYDPHVWVSPLRIIQQAQTIFDALAEIDPENSGYYEENFTSLKSKLTKLDEDIRDASKSFKSKVIVVSHESFGYFAKDYGFKQIAIKGINPQEEPSPPKMAELVRESRENNVKYIFFEKLTSPKLSETLAREVGAGTLVLNNMEGLSEEDIKAGKDYITVMYENLENLKKALGD